MSSIVTNTTNGVDASKLSHHQPSGTGTGTGTGVTGIGVIANTNTTNSQPATRTPNPTPSTVAIAPTPPPTTTPTLATAPTTTTNTTNNTNTTAPIITQPAPIQPQANTTPRLSQQSPTVSVVTAQPTIQKQLVRSTLTAAKSLTPLPPNQSRPPSATITTNTNTTTATATATTNTTTTPPMATPTPLPIVAPRPVTKPITNPVLPTVAQDGSHAVKTNIPAPLLVTAVTTAPPIQSHTTGTNPTAPNTTTVVPLATTLPPSATLVTIPQRTTGTVALPPSVIKKQITNLPPSSVPSAALIAAKATKSKKKKNQPTVTMATAPSATQGGSGAQGENTGRWTAEEHRLFLQGLEQHGKGWKKIASLIKSRTVVQIRTHAQKYFQKLAKARQNGEEGDVAMEGRGGLTAVTAPLLTSSTPTAGKRRRTLSGTKRKALSTVVHSAQREGKKLAVPGGRPPLPAVAPALAPFVVPGPPPPPPTNITEPQPPSTVLPHGTISGPALEDSLFRFLTPAPVSTPSPEQVQVADVARQAGANPITLPSDSSSGGDTVASPTGVADVSIFPSWTDGKDMPSWYAKGVDVDSLLDVADTLNWLSDSGDLHETYEPPPDKPALSTSPEDSMIKPPSVTDLALPSDESGVVPALPSLFESSDADSKKPKLDGDMDEHLNVFDTPMEEHAFVSALLDSHGESSGSLPVLQ
eukprot:CAMPEP_0202451478 /NCGR_PEP_ID=MMETSP1360-20130828/9901_1 /ASSEMBLY_ACC=CAM_ASM_000848 /TAXON_ID=515479 /ORGANISM="Licmophora paradoxa, Strain CCMP2313" /LENGTH=696 /DNA_ID=CAMNT_0049070055 /DNA_START=106 /DNA_END=2196 /DNA_ORIENTATION=+